MARTGWHVCWICLAPYILETVAAILNLACVCGCSWLRTASDVAVDWLASQHSRKLTGG